MSDQSPPPKPKPGSLRDRIAAFENKGSAAPSTAPPAPRPKPAGLQWKPKAPSPPSSPGSSADNVQPAERKIAGVGGMSASDAMESIGRGGSLKERMAALQGRGGFGGAPPPVAPKPTEKPKWKPPPVVSPPVDEDEPEREEIAVIRGTSKSPPPVAERRSEEPETDTPDVAKEGQDAGSSEPDPQEEERQRRAAIAARMARLGGARVGMGPPIFAPKPSFKKPEVSSPEAKQEDEATPLKGDDDGFASEGVSTPKQDTTGTPAEGEAPSEPVSEYFGARKDSTSSTSLSAQATPPAPSRSPSHMPVPAGPRRAAPPRKKAYKSPSPAAEPVAMVTSGDQVTTPEQLSVSNDADREAELSTGDVQREIGEVNKSAEESQNAVEAQSPVSEDLAQDDVPTREAPQPPQDVVDEPSPPPTEPVQEKTLPDDVENNQLVPEAGQSLHDSPAELEDTEGPHKEPVDPEPEQGRVQEEEIEEDEDEDARRKRVAKKLAQMGAFNPFAGPPPVPRRESTSEVVREAEPEAEPDVDEEVNVGVEEVGESIPPPPVLRREFGTLNASAAESKLEGHTSGRKDSIGSSTMVVDERAFERGHSPDVMKEQEIGGAETHDQDDVATHEVLVAEEEEEIAEEFPEDGVRHRTLYHHNGSDADEGGEENDCTHGQAVAAGSYSDRGDDEQYISDDNVDEPIPHQRHGEESEDDRISQEHFQAAKGADLSDKGAERDAEDNEGHYADSDNFDAGPSQDDNDDDMGPPRITRPIPPPPVNMGTRPTFAPSLPSPRVPPPRTPLHTLRDGEAERAESPDPRPVPPPSSTRNAWEFDEDEEAPAPPPRRSFPPPPRRSSTSGGPTESYATREAPPTPPPVPISPRPSVRRATSPPVASPPSAHEELPAPHESIEEESIVTQAPADPSPEQDEEEDEEVARRQTIAERMARLGGIRFGAPVPPTNRAPPPPPPPPRTEEEQPSTLDPEGTTEQTEEEEELARKQRIAAKLAGMGGMRFGMLPPSVAPPRKPPVITRQEDSENEDAALKPLPVPAPQRTVPPARPPPPPVASDSEQESRTTDEDGVKVEVEESEAEEVTYEDVKTPEEEVPPPVPGRQGRRPSTAPRAAEALPTPPPRMMSRSPPLPGGRPPVPSIPTTLLNRRPSIPVPPPGSTPSRKSSVHSVESQRQSRPTLEAVPSESKYRPQSEYVMVEAPLDVEPEAAPLPPKRPIRGPPPRSAPLPPPPPPSAVEPMTSSNQWELPSFSDAPLELGLGDDIDPDSLTGSEDSPSQPHPPPLPKPRSRPSSQLPPSQSPKTAPETQLSSDELMEVWGKVGVQVCEAATALHEKSKKSLVGDGSYVGFVKAVLGQVSTALQPSGPEADFGYLVYAQTAGAVLRRASDIMPGDVIVLYDARLKGHKGLQTYHQSVGVVEPLVGVVHEFEAKKSKVRVYQANQHVGQQTVESASYRLEDLKSGHVKVFRVLEA
ncbi:hypothetical protein BV22DRAFT_1066606 [Leucogyrophana mollusca]|uniref:Uncharacterized protein n=1 Tax=Leucogyrophana mollusca TaxID=85980 RepID=A0ACB8BGL1_9AGAM|nr:hypothetical protein BV22DRAFT_1066606 [Leucogyrophana mollusca]